MWVHAQGPGSNPLMEESKDKLVSSVSWDWHYLSLLSPRSLRDESGYIMAKESERPMGYGHEGQTLPRTESGVLPWSLPSRQGKGAFH